MMEIRGNMMSVREDALIVDATLRDGGLVNDFYFTDEFVKDLYKANIAAGVDYMEFGYRADKDQFDVNKFGKWKFSSDQDIIETIGEKNPQTKIAIMADVGRCDYKHDFVDKEHSPVDLIRVATYINTMPEAIAMIKEFTAKGYEATCNIMAVSKCQERELKAALDMVAATDAKATYVVDSNGALYPIEVRDLIADYMAVMEPVGKLVGIHAHNNQQCAFANTIESMQIGASMMDGTVMGMGRGAGNCSLEALLGFLKNPKYDIAPILRFIEKHMLKLIEDGVVWGYNIPYLLTGLTDNHPRTAIAATKAKDTKYLDFYNMLLD